MSNQVIDLLKKLRKAALDRDLKALISYHEEDSYLMRFANSAISLNTNEHLISLDFIAFDGRKKASYSMIVDPSDFAAMEKGLDILAEMLPHASRSLMSQLSQFMRKTCLTSALSTRHWQP